MTKEDREIWAQESRMREHESACEILSPLPHSRDAWEVLCAVLGAVTSYATRITNDE
jgi:hypothetical protein